MYRLASAVNEPSETLGKELVRLHHMYSYVCSLQMSQRFFTELTNASERIFVISPRSPPYRLSANHRPKNLCLTHLFRRDCQYVTVN